jgi:lipopolysaccharide/colanic/teichoic acid biosynthesis glycosyltransferase
MTTASRSYERTKRAIDVCVAAGALVLTLPLLLAVAIGVAVTMGRPILFWQYRPGRHGRLFRIVKFRTMTEPSEPGVGPAADAGRLTRIGRWLRATSLDELPTLWNVLRGEMSLVGPRPLLVEYLDRYRPEQTRRHEVLPGITGLAQIHGRNAVSWEAKLGHDVSYVDARCTRLDLQIMYRTVRLVLRGYGVTAPGCATAHEYVQPGTVRPTASDPNSAPHSNDVVA